MIRELPIDQGVKVQDYALPKGSVILGVNTVGNKAYLSVLFAPDRTQLETVTITLLGTEDDDIDPGLFIDKFTVFGLTRYVFKVVGDGVSVVRGEIIESGLAEMMVERMVKAGLEVNQANVHTLWTEIMEYVGVTVETVIGLE